MRGECTVFSLKNYSGKPVPAFGSPDLQNRGMWITGLFDADTGHIKNFPDKKRGLDLMFVQGP